MIRVDDELVLRSFVTTDHADLLTAFHDPDIVLWNPQTRDAAGVEVWAAARNDWSDDRHASWAVAELQRSGGRLVGAVSLHKIDLDQGDGEIGYWVAPWARGRGIATRAVRSAAHHGFEVAGLRRIYLFHAADNVASCKVAASSGFLLEGTLRQSHRYGDGAHHDEHLHARLASD